jgi:hypothetical protein
VEENLAMDFTAISSVWKKTSLDAFLGAVAFQTMSSSLFLAYSKKMPRKEYDYYYYYYYL